MTSPWNKIASETYEAADRIEALTADIERLQARVAELEEALRIIANHRQACRAYDDDAGHQPRVFDEEDVRLLEWQARAALKETDHD